MSPKPSPLNPSHPAAESGVIWPKVTRLVNAEVQLGPSHLLRPVHGVFHSIRHLTTLLKGIS